MRIIAATNRNLEEEVVKGEFRKDLFFRLNVYPVSLPTLRQRKEDIPQLVNHFVAQFAKKMKKDHQSHSPKNNKSITGIFLARECERIRKCDRKSSDTLQGETAWR